MIRTRFTELFGLEYPLMSAPMAMHSGGTLAGAVTRAGGLGSFGGVNPTGGPEWLRGEVDKIRATTTGPFAIGFITPFVPMTMPLFDAALESAPDAIALSFSDPTEWVDSIKGAGAKVICQVQSPHDAQVAVDAGADVLVAQGTEAGGHTGTMALLPLLSHVVAAHPDVPVLAAGGVADGRTLAAVLMAGADGAWLGTAFLATPEAVEIDEVHKTLIVESDGSDTELTRAYDIVSGIPWPAQIGERVRSNRFTAQWAGRIDELRERREEVASQRVAPLYGVSPDPDEDPILYGQSAALVPSIRPAAEVVRSISHGAEEILRTRSSTLTS